jgi:hypothetical protein
MRNLSLLLIFFISVTGCTLRTITDVPALSGVVVDSNNGKPLENVRCNDQLLTSSHGQFAFPAVSEQGWLLLAPGAGVPVTRKVVFQKDGYRDTTCLCTNFSLFSEDNRAVIPLLRVDKSEAAPATSIYLRLDDTRVECEAFVGARVEYRGGLYLIFEIIQQEQDGMLQNLFVLAPIPPNEGDVVMDISEYGVRLTSKRAAD